VPKSKVFLASAVSLAVVLSACSGARSAEPTTTFGTVPGVAPTLPTLAPDSTTPAQTTPLSPVLSSVDTSTTTTTTPSTDSTTPSSSSSSTSSSTTTDWEVVGGIFTTKAAAQSQIDKLTAAKFTGFSLKAVGAKTAAVLPGLTKAAATAMAAKINTAGVASATTFHLTIASTSSTTTDWEVVGGIFTTKAAAQSQIDKLTAAKFTGFSLKAVGAKTAAVLPGLTNADATALAAKINKAGVATATTFHLTSSSTSTTTTTTTVEDSTATNYEVVDGIFSTEADAQAKIDKLTAAKFTKFTIKPIPGEFAVVKAGLTKAEATDLMTKINAANLGPARIKAL
jgi:cell division septation protein DedD